MKAKCPKCGWTTRDLEDDEVDMVKEGRYRCSGKCQEESVPNQMSSFPPRVRLMDEVKKHGDH
jgi:hypothetical protein